MILYEDTVVKYRDGTMKSLDELGGEVSELASNTPVKSGSTSKPLDEFIQDQIVLAPESPVVDGEDTTTLEDFIEETVGVDDLVHKTGTEEITGTKTFRDEVRVHTQTALSEYLTKYESDCIESNVSDFAITGQQKVSIDSDVDVDGDLELTGNIIFENGGGVDNRSCVINLDSDSTYNGLRITVSENNYVKPFIMMGTQSQEFAYCGSLNYDGAPYAALRDDNHNVVSFTKNQNVFEIKFSDIWWHICLIGRLGNCTFEKITIV